MYQETELKPSCDVVLTEKKKWLEEELDLANLTINQILF